MLIKPYFLETVKYANPKLDLLSMLQQQWFRVIINILSQCCTVSSQMNLVFLKLFFIFELLIKINAVNKCEKEKYQLLNVSFICILHRTITRIHGITHIKKCLFFYELVHNYFLIVNENFCWNKFCNWIWLSKMSIFIGTQKVMEKQNYKTVIRWRIVFQW